MSSSGGSPEKAILYAFLANTGIAVCKFGAAIYTSSGSMLAEAIHSMADSGNQVLLYIGLRGAQRPPDKEHPMGYGKLSYFWSFIVALMLFSVGGLFSIYEGIHKLHGEAELNDLWVGMVVLAGAIILEAGSLLGATREVRLMKGDQTFMAWLKHTRNAEIVVVLGEDIAAIIGLVIALGFLAMTYITGNPVFDAIGSICIGVVLILVAIFVAIRIQSLLIGRSAEPALVASINSAIEADEGIEALLNTITIQFGPRVMLAVKIKMRPELTLQQAVEGINQLEKSIKLMHPEVGWCFVEPDTTD